MNRAWKRKSLSTRVQELEQENRSLEAKRQNLNRELERQGHLKQDVEAALNTYKDYLKEQIFEQVKSGLERLRPECEELIGLAKKLPEPLVASTLEELTDDYKDTVESLVLIQLILKPCFESLDQMTWTDFLNRTKPKGGN